MSPCTDSRVNSNYERIASRIATSVTKHPEVPRTIACTEFCRSIRLVNKIYPVRYTLSYYW